MSDETTKEINVKLEKIAVVEEIKLSLSQIERFTGKRGSVMNMKTRMWTQHIRKLIAKL